ncbi:MAG: gliding motility-associated C-terminal domain-containing protein [Bacteroidota bacterium]
MRPTLQILFILLFSFFTKNIWAGNSCNTATPISNNMSLFETYSNLGTNNSGTPAPPCGNYVSNDFWFSTTVPATGFVSVVLQPGTMVNPALAIYTDFCGNLNLEGCSSEDLCGNLSSAVYEGSGLAPASIIYIRVWAVGGAPNGTFDIRVSSANPPAPVPLGLNALVGTATNSGNCIQLTSAINTQLGCAWDSNQEDMTQVIEKIVVLNFGNNNGGADGITLGFQNAPTGINTCGIGGGGIGADGIPNSFIIEFDTWDNGVAVGDIPQDHAAIFVNGVNANPINGPVALNGGNIEDGQDHVVRIVWDGGTFAYEVYFDEVLVLNGTYDIITNCLNGNNLAHWGTTASTGGANNTHTICPYQPEPYFGGTEQVVDVTICEGESYFAGGANQTTTGVYVDNLPLPNGCLSVTTTNLTVLPSSTSTVNETVCIGSCVTIGTQTFCNQGTFQVTLDNQNFQGCDSIVTLNVEVLNPQAVIVTNPIPTIDCNNPIITLDGGFSTMGGNVTYQWSGPCIISDGDTPFPQVGCAGSYSLLVIQNVGTTSCDDVETVIVLDDQTPPIANAGADQVLDCTTGCTFLDGSSSSSGSNFLYSWTGPGGFSSTDQNPLVCNPGSYILTVFNTLNNCSDNSSVNVTGGVAPTADAGDDAVIDCNNPTATLNGGNSSSGAGFDLVWLDANGNQVGTGTTFSTSDAGTYTLVVTDIASGCFSSDDAIVTGNSIVPNADAGLDGVIDCINMSVTLDGSSSTTGSGISLIWQDANGNQVGNGPIYTATTAGTYTLVVTNTANGCTNSDIAVVTEDSNAPNADAGLDMILDCNNQSVTLDGSNSSNGSQFELAWQDANGNPIGTGTTVTVANAGIYTLVVTDNTNGCVASDVVEVTLDNVPPVANAGADMTITCNNTFANLDGSNSNNGIGFDLVWQDALGNQVGNGNLFSTMNPGTYTLVVTNTTNGCISTDDVEVSENTTSPVADAGADAILDCINNTITLDGSNSNNGNGFTLVWQNANGDQVGNGTTFSTSTTGTYTLIVTDDTNGCSNSDEVTVFGNINLPTADAGDDQVLTCDVLEVTLNGSASSSGTNFSYQWQNSNAQVLGNDIFLIVADPDTYTLIVTDNANGCSQSATVFVTQDIALPVADAGQGSTLSCTTNAVTLDGSNSSQGNFSYQWFNANNTNVGTGISIEVASADTYTLVVTNLDNGCTATDEVEILQDNNVPTVTAISDGNLTCTNLEVLLDGTGSSTGQNIQYEWLDDQSNLLGNDLTVNISLSGIYTLVVSDAISGCSSSINVVVNENTTLPTVNIATPSVLTCTVDEVTLDGSNSSSGGNFEYEWLNDNQDSVGVGSIINVGSTGFYTLVVTDTDNGCTNFAAVEVTQDGDVPVASIESLTTTLNCDIENILLQNTGSSTGNEITYLWTDANGQLSTDANVEIISQGTYTLVVTDNANGCSAETSIVISEDIESPIIATDANVITCAQPTSILDGTGSSDGTAFIYEWQDDLGNTITNEISTEILQSGIYNFIVTNTTNGCSTSETVVVVEDITTIIADAGDDATLTCGTTTVTLDGSNSTNNADVIYEWFNSANVLLGNGTELEANTADTFFLVVTDQNNGCADTASVEVLQDANLPTSDIFADEVLTCNNLDVNLDGTGSTGIGDLEFSWSDPNGNFISNENNIEVTTIGNYELAITDLSNGCSSTATFLVEENLTPPIADAGANDTISCTANVATLNGTNSSLGNDFIYEWFNPSGISIGNAPLLNTSESGIFTLIVTDFSNGCSASSTVEIVQTSNLPTATILPADLITCDQSSVTLVGAMSSGAGTLSFQWFNTIGQPLAATPNLNVSQSGTYILDVTDASNGCVASTSVLVEENITPPLAATNPVGAITCDQDFYTLNASGSSTGSGFEYEWQDANGNSLATAFSYDATSSGIYNLIVTNIANGCTSEITTEVLEDLAEPNPVALATDVLTCATTTVTLDGMASTGSSGDILFEWLNPLGDSIGAMSTVNVSTPGVYQMIITNESNGCSAATNITVEENTALPQPTIDALTNLSLTCDQSSLVVDGSGSLPLGNVTYEWSINNVVVSNDPNPQIDEAGNLVLTVTDTQNGCTASTSVEITQDSDFPNITITNPDILTCNTTSIELDATGSSTGIDFEYQWTGAPNIQNATTLTPTISQAGTYTLTITNPDNGCVTSSEITVDEDVVPPVINVAPAEEFDCVTSAVTLDASTSSVGNNFSYQWTTANGIISNNVTTLTPTVSTAGIYTLTITNNDNGCVATQSITVNESNEVITGADFIINQPPCFDDEGSIFVENVIGGTPPFLYSIDNQPFTNSSNFNFLTAGDYVVLIEDATGCQYSEEVTIDFVPELTVNLPESITIRLGDNYQLQPQINYALTDIASIIWTPADSLTCADCLNPTAAPQNSTRYQITVTNTNGCIATASIWIFVEKPREVFIPNVFTPNDDGVNDIFYIFANDQTVREVKRFQVFSRWGEVVFSDANFQPNEPVHGWDGFFKGERMNPTVLVYFAEIEFIDGVTKVYKGDVTLR